jgi:hypothetical protein
MRVFKVDAKRIFDFEIGNRIAQAKNLSFTVENFHFDGEKVAVKVRATDGKRVEEEVVAFTLSALLDQLNRETVAKTEEERERNRIRVENYAVQFAVERAKKSLTAKFTLNRKPYLPEEIKLFEEVELFSLYIPEGLRLFKRLAREKPQLALELAEKYDDLTSFIPATEKQRKLIKKLVKERGIKDAEYRRTLKKRYKVSSSLCLSRDEASDFISHLKRST